VGHRSPPHTPMTWVTESWLLSTRPVNGDTFRRRRRHAGPPRRSGCETHPAERERRVGGGPLRTLCRSRGDAQSDCWMAFTLAAANTHRFHTFAICVLLGQTTASLLVCGETRMRTRHRVWGTSTGRRRHREKGGHATETRMLRPIPRTSAIGGSHDPRSVSPGCRPTWRPEGCRRRPNRAGGHAGVPTNHAAPNRPGRPADRVGRRRIGSGAAAFPPPGPPPLRLLTGGSAPPARVRRTHPLKPTVRGEEGGARLPPDTSDCGRGPAAGRVAPPRLWVRVATAPCRPAWAGPRAPDAERGGVPHLCHPRRRAAQVASRRGTRRRGGGAWDPRRRSACLRAWEGGGRWGSGTCARVGDAAMRMMLRLWRVGAASLRLLVGGAAAVCRRDDSQLMGRRPVDTAVRRAADAVPRGVHACHNGWAWGARARRTLLGRSWSFLWGPIARRGRRRPGATFAIRPTRGRRSAPTAAAPLRGRACGAQTGTGRPRRVRTRAQVGAVADSGVRGLAGGRGGS